MKQVEKKPSTYRSKDLEEPRHRTMMDEMKKSTEATIDTRTHHAMIPTAIWSWL